ncbi:MAG: UDP-N-acetylmuramoyl-L-alanine--D-glutamate ligase [bacterium]
MQIKDFSNKKITIMGLGLHGGGVGSARFFARAGAKVLVTDLKKEAELVESIDKLKEFKNIEYVLGQHRIEDFQKTDLIIKNPAVPNNSKHLAVARENKVPVDTDLGIFFELCPARIIGITGSKGKSTTASLCAEVLKKKYLNVILAGNIRISVLDVLMEIKESSIVILELSSWQLEGLRQHKKSPHIAIITNIYKEHLDRYENFEDYIKSKKLIFKFQGKNDILIINKKLRKLARNTESEIKLFDGTSQEAARIVGEIHKVSEKDIEKAIRNFQGLEGRLEFVKEIDGVKYYNDTCATHPEAVIYGLNDFNHIVLIAGGSDKNLDFTKLNKILDQKIKALILLPGTASSKIKTRRKTIEVENMEQAVLEAKKIAKSDDVVLLSPGCASFGLFKHEFDRGDKFKKYVQAQA